MLRDETAIPSSINLGRAFVKYWDDSAMVAVLEFKVEAPPQPKAKPRQPVATLYHHDGHSGHDRMG
jgi:hypothetical protein